VLRCLPAAALRPSKRVMSAFPFPKPCLAAGLLVFALGCGGREAAAPEAPVPGHTLALLAGSAGGPGDRDGPGPQARFDQPHGVAVDGQGNLYVADCPNNTIRRVTPDGMVTTLAGMAGLTGSADGPGPAARFNAPTGVAVDGQGNVYVADCLNATIRKVTPAGMVSTLAGTVGVRGSRDGAGATFDGPLGVAVDAAGNVFVADAGNGIIRKVTPDGVVSTLAGAAGVRGGADGTGAAASFGNPFGVAVDGAGLVYVADGGHTLRRITQAGAVTTLAGLAGSAGSADGTGSAARFDDPYGVAADAQGNVYVADTGNHTIRRLTAAGAVTTLAGAPGLPGSADGTGAGARFDNPLGVAVDKAGNVYVADFGNDALRRITPDGAVTTLAGAAAVHGAADGAGAAASFNAPDGVAADGLGNVYVADAGNHTIRMISPAGEVTTLAGQAGTEGSADGVGAAATFREPHGVAVDGAGNVYVADSGNSTLRRIGKGGEVTTLAGAPGNPGSADGTGSAAQFQGPLGLALDAEGNLLVADAGNNTLRRVTPAGVVTTLAGNPGAGGSADGPGPLATFNFPVGLAVDGSGNLYVADSGNRTLRVCSPSGAVTTLAGTAGLAGSQDGTGAAAGFGDPRGVAVGGDGCLYVADLGNDTLRRVTPGGAVTTVAGVAGVPGTVLGAWPGGLDAPMGLAFDPASGALVLSVPNAVLTLQ